MQKNVGSIFSVSLSYSTSMEQVFWDDALKMEHVGKTRDDRIHEMYHLAMLHLSIQ